MTAITRHGQILVDSYNAPSFPSIDVSQWSQPMGVTEKGYDETAEGIYDHSVGL